MAIEVSSFVPVSQVYQGAAEDDAAAKTETNGTGTTTEVNGSERRAQEGEDVSVLENPGPIKYHAGQNVKTRAADAGLILRARRFPLRQLMRESGASQHAIERFLDGDRIHPSTRARLARAAEKLERGHCERS